MFYKHTYKTPVDGMSSGVIFILGKGVSSILAYGVKPTWPQGESAPGFSICVCLCYYAIIKVFEL